MNYLSHLILKKHCQMLPQTFSSYWLLYVDCTLLKRGPMMEARLSICASTCGNWTLYTFARLALGPYPWGAWCQWDRRTLQIWSLAHTFQSRELAKWNKEGLPSRGRWTRGTRRPSLHLWPFQHIQSMHSRTLLSSSPPHLLWTSRLSLSLLSSP